MNRNRVRQAQSDRVGVIEVPHVKQDVSEADAVIAGLTSAETRKRLAEFGQNRIGNQRRAGAFGLFIAQFKSPIILILIGAAVVSLFLQDRTDDIIPNVCGSRNVCAPTRLVERNQIHDFRSSQTFTSCVSAR